MIPNSLRTTSHQLPRTQQRTQLPLSRLVHVTQRGFNHPFVRLLYPSSRLAISVRSLGSSTVSVISSTSTNGPTTARAATLNFFFPLRIRHITFIISIFIVRVALHFPSGLPSFWIVRRDYVITVGL
ncbi:hypothetical protein CPC08DRAFT_198288 [Agrocybe pediades]|nr:hypothetical protein CPC08DRAFT_198288 [Agrocybe pediades]